MISAIIFDCDGVLVDSESLALEVGLSVLTEMGLHYERTDYKKRFFGRSMNAYFKELADDAERRGIALPADFRERLDYEVLDDGLLAVEGVHEAVDAVRQLKAVASSSTAHSLESKLRKTRLWERFAPHVYSADHVRHTKPAPDLFFYAADKLAVAPARCLVLEDSTLGVTAARAAGMPVWGFVGGSHNDSDSGPRLLQAGAERIVADWAEAASLFVSL